MTISKIIIPIAIIILMGILTKISLGKSKKDRQGNKILRMPILYSLIGGFVLMISILIIVFGFLLSKPEGYLWVVLSFFIAALLGLPLLLVGLVFKITI
jgi:hypothetical protein